jgi:basic amino acid/polyamine antiporter, APA family
LGDRGVRAVAILGIVLLSAVNYLGIKPGGALQTVLTAVKLAAIVAIVALVFLHGHAAGPNASAAASADVSPRNFLLAISAGLFAFGGWHMVTYTSGETENARRTIPRALLIGTLIVAGCYVALNAAYLYILPLDRILHSTRIAADAATTLIGPNGAAAITALVVISAMGSLNGIILAGPRVYFAMAQDGLWFRWMAAIHPRFQTPHLAILAQAVWSSVLVATGTYRVLFTRVVYTEWLFFGLMTIGLLRMRGSRLRWGSIVPLVFLTGCVLIVANQIVADPLESATGLLLVAAGLPFYFYVHHRRS